MRRTIAAGTLTSLVFLVAILPCVGTAADDEMPAPTSSHDCRDMDPDHPAPAPAPEEGCEASCVAATQATLVNAAALVSASTSTTTASTIDKTLPATTQERRLPPELSQPPPAPPIFVLNEAFLN